MTSTPPFAPSDSFAPPSLYWGEDGIPRSNAYDDVYFSLHDGWQESRHAFFDGVQVAQRWQGQRSFCLAETGFGTGRNFLLTWQAWRNDPNRPAVLDYISVEGFPLSAPDLRRAHDAVVKDPALTPFAQALCAAWPEAHPGFHLRLFDQGRVRLLLLFGDVRETLGQLATPPHGVDGWYLDGFAPSKNPEMWSPEVFSLVARHSKPGTRFGTYAAAGHVRRGLEAVGFAVERRPGHGRKRECLAGVFTPTDTHRRAPQTEKPWFRIPSPLPAGARVAILGGGVAGCAMAAALHRTGFSPVLFERHAHLAQEGSGNPCGLLKPRLTADGGIHGRFYAQATLFAQATLPTDGWVRKGIFHLARDADEAALQQRLAGTLAPGHAVPLDPEQAQTVAQVSAPHGGLWFPFAGAIRPQAVCQGLAAQVPDLSIVRETAPIPVLQDGGGWAVGDHQVDAVVLAAGAYNTGLWPTADLPIFCNRGQISVIAEGEQADTLPQAALSFGGYLSPSFTDPTLHGGPVRVLGATYRRLPAPDSEDWAALSEADHAAVADDLATHLPQVAATLAAKTQTIGGRAALRATIADHMPLAGPLFQADQFRQDFADLHHGRRPSAYPDAQWVPGLYILGGLGSRGFQTAPLLAEHLVSMMTGSASPLPLDLAEAVHPARFLVRTLKKKPKRQHLQG